LRFIAEVFFGPGKPRADMAILAVVKEMIQHTTDISAIILANTFSAFDKCHYRSKHFTGCASLAQLWFAGHFDYRPYEPGLSPASTYLKSPFKYQHGTKEAIHTAIMSTNEGEVKWNLMPVQHPSPVCLMIDRTRYKLMILPGLRGGIEYHPIRILKQLGFMQTIFDDALMPERFKQYPQDDIHIMQEINNAIRNGVSTEQLDIPAALANSKNFSRMRRAYWPTPTDKPECRGSHIPRIPLCLEGPAQDTAKDAGPATQKRVRHE
jgi:hypothetical protein